MQRHAAGLEQQHAVEEPDVGQCDLAAGQQLERRARVIDERRALQRGYCRLAVVQRQEARGPLRRRGTDCRVRRYRNISASGDGERERALDAAHSRACAIEV